MTILRGLISVAGRILLCAIFVMSAAGNKIPNFEQTADMMAKEGMPTEDMMGLPMTYYLLAGAIAFTVLGSLSIIFGLLPRLGAALLLIFLVLATYYFHDFWTVPPDARWVLSTDPSATMPAQQVEMINFLKNVGLMGAMLLIIANGVGPFSLDAKIWKKSA